MFLLHHNKRTELKQFYPLVLEMVPWFLSLNGRVNMVSCLSQCKISRGHPMLISGIGEVVEGSILMMLGGHFE